MQDAAGSWHPRLMFHALDHVILAVRDLDAASRAYAILLGLRASWRGEHPGEGTANTLFRVDNTYLELLAPVGPGATRDAVRANLEVRGEGLLIGIKAVVPSGDLVAALRAEKLLTVGAGDNVVRFLPPLIVNEAEIEDSVARLERACAAISSSQTKRAAS